MANEREPKAKQSAADAVRTPRPKTAPTPEVSLTRRPVSTSKPTVTTARNATLQGNAAISSDEIRQRAYELYEKRGRLEGFHEQDWLEAESQIRNGRNSSKQDARRKSA